MTELEHTEPLATPEAAGPPTAPTPAAAATAAEATSGPLPAAPGTAPVVTGGAAGGRWLLAFGVSGAVLAITAAAIVVLGARSTPEALRYIPGDVGVVAELRMDLPGDQLQKVGNLLAHFPGFKDQSTLPAKIDESLGRIVGSISGGGINYATDLQPWLAGPVFAGAPLAAGGGTGGTAAMASLIVATTDGKVSCDAAFKGTTTKSETYRGVTLQYVEGGSMACAIDGRYGLLGSQSMVHAGLDAHADHTGIDTKASYLAARDALHADVLASIYVSRDAMSGLGTIPSILGGGPDASGLLGSALARLPAWTIVGLHAEDDALVLDSVTAPVPAAPEAPGASPLATAPPAHASRIAPLLPADTAALVEVHGAGILAQNALAALQASPSLNGALGQVNGALGVLGGAGQLVGWVDDLGIVVVPDGSTVTGGVVLLAPDEATATAKADQIRGLLSLAGLSGGAVTHDEVVNGTKVTIADLGDISTLLQATGTNVNVPSGTHVILSLAVHGSAVIIGGETFAARILDNQTGGALSDQAGYRRALARAAEQNLGEVYIGGSSLLTIAENAMAETDRPKFDTDVKPYLEPVDVILATISVENGNPRLRIVASVK